MQWQPVPDGIPLRTPLAILSGALLIAGGGGLLLRKWQRQAALLLALNYGFWTIVLHGWRVLGDPGVLIEWNGIAEIGFLTCGAVALYASTATCARRDTAQVGAADGGCLCTDVRRRSLPLPRWHGELRAGMDSAKPAFLGLRQRRGLPCGRSCPVERGSGAPGGHADRLMMACFVLLLHLPRVIGDPELRVEWIMLAVASSLTGAAWLVRKYAT